jgi:hypothetical protein
MTHLKFIIKLHRRQGIQIKNKLNRNKKKIKMRIKYNQIKTIQGNF